MTNQINVRAATDRDLDLITDLIRELAIYEKLGDSFIASSDAIRAALFCEKPSAEVLIGELNDEAVGFALYFHNYSTFLGKRGLYLEDLFVKPAARGYGVGKLLLKTLAKVAAERDCGRMEWFVLDWNTPSIAFYKSLGAEPLNEWTVFRMTADKIKALSA
ncbi:GNAT family N-acetyltransferase [Rhizobium sp. CNPSo 4039]|uniref:GNAT family N-acetyltransferase n=1 Tax=Rhizobium sp. CNPSo 4039 TaxID=3021409 RepID=UPI00254A0968|nr:GNAT family N-acetyltransferase [Rhizobium sp. CNPSo 4039]MDK4717625.1 GNAT family N-acetyltransferase [Rhizobium sp. CNPSo 4039]